MMLKGLATAPARYVGRFAPSPTGPLHMGSLVTALASWLDARAHGGLWLVRIEDLDRARCVPDASEDILRTLASFGLRADAEPVWQSRRTAHYAQALERLIEHGHAYPCACTRKEIADSLRHLRERHQTLAYPGTCRPENGGLGGRPPRAWRVRVPDQGTADAGTLAFDDRWQGRCAQDLAREVGDFVVRRADGEWAYQLAVVVDDALQGVTDIVRGADLLDSTARQIWLQRLLDVPTPRYLHVPVVTNAEGEKLSKQTGAAALDAATPLASLRQAGEHLGLGDEPALAAAATPAEWLAGAVKAWRARLSLS